MNRRKFLLGAAGGAALLGVGYAGYLARAAFSQPLVTRTSWALGSDVSLTVGGLPGAAAERALDAAFAELETLEQVMSLYRPESQICRLNREPVLRNPHPHLVTVLQMAEQTSRETGGAFDVSVQPLWDLYATAKRAERLPTAAELSAARATIDWRHVSVSSTKIELQAPVQAITLNGIAQGYAVDCALAVLKEHGATRALVNTGEIGSLGDKTAGDPWTMGIQHPRERDAFLTVTDLDGRALATSGDYETTFSNDFAKNHIFDPRTGDSPAELASVSIVAPTGLQADALSTAAMVLGVERTLALISRLPNVDALLVDKEGNIIRTAGFPSSVAS